MKNMKFAVRGLVGLTAGLVALGSIVGLALDLHDVNAGYITMAESAVEMFTQVTLLSLCTVVACAKPVRSSKATRLMSKGINAFCSMQSIMFAFLQIFNLNDWGDGLMTTAELQSTFFATVALCVATFVGLHAVHTVVSYALNKLGDVLNA